MIKSTTESKLASHIDPKVTSHDDNQLETLDESVYEKLAEPSNGFDLDIVYQTNPAQFSSLIYLGGKEDFEKASKKKRRRRKKRAAGGDAMYLQYQPYSNGKNYIETDVDGDFSKINPLLKIYLKPKSSNKFEEFEIPLINVFKKIDGTPKTIGEGQGSKHRFGLFQGFDISGEVQDLSGKFILGPTSSVLGSLLKVMKN